MAKFITKLPKSVLDRIVKSRGHKLSLEEDDIYEIAKKGVNITPSIIMNNTNLNNKNVLEFIIANEMFHLLNLFNKDLFSDDVIKLLASKLDCPKFAFEYLSKDQLKMCSNNQVICKKMIEKDIKYLSILKPSQITPEVLEILEKTEYIPTEEDISKYPNLCLSKNLIMRTLDENPNLALKLDTIDEEVLFAIIYSKNIDKLHLTRSDIERHPVLKYDLKLMDNALENDPTTIALFEGAALTEQRVWNAVKNGYIPTKEDLEKNISLTKNVTIMEKAITKEPSLIAYLRCDALEQYRGFALEYYEVTEEDLKSNPYLCRLKDVIESMGPGFENYYTGYTIDQKLRIIKNKLKQGHYEGHLLDNIPFLSSEYGSETSLEDQKQLFDLFSEIKLPTELDYYFSKYSTLMDQLVMYKYKKDKKRFRYSNINEIDRDVRDVFQKASKTEDMKHIEKFAQELIVFIGNESMLPKEEIQLKLFELYKKYLSNELGNDQTIDFYNHILNAHRNHYFRQMLSEIKKEIIYNLPLSKDKMDKLIVSKKCEKVKKYIKAGEYDKIGTTEESLVERAKNLRNVFPHLKPLKKGKISIPEDIYEEMERKFAKKGFAYAAYGTLYLRLKKIGCSDEMLTLIDKRYSSLLHEYINDIHISMDEITDADIRTVKENIEFIPKNFSLDINHHFNLKLLEVILSLDEEQMKDALSNKEYFGEIKELIMLSGLTEDFDNQKIVNILCNYSRIRERVLRGTDGNVDMPSLLLSKLGLVMEIADAFSSIDDIKTFILGENVASSSEFTEGHFDFYMQMRNKLEGQIPPVKINLEELELASGEYDDPQRLLIRMGGCLYLNSSAIVETQLKPTGDVLLVKKDNETVSRALMFRRGNVVNIAPFVGSEKFFSGETLNEIGKQIIDSSKEAGDSIDYVFIQAYNAPNGSIVHDIYELSEFGRKVDFPHADLSRYVVLIGASNQSEIRSESCESFHLDLTQAINVSYPKKRKEVTDNPTSEDITKIQALRIELEPDKKKKNEMAKGFMPCLLTDYTRVICGEDWYIARKIDGSIEEVILPTSDPRAIAEFDKAKQQFQQNDQNNQKRGVL